MLNIRVRKYDYDLGRFTCPDPMWEKYYSWTPYQYALNNPLILKDGGGMIVVATDENARRAIINSVEKDYRSNIGFTNDGTDYFKEKTDVPAIKDDLSNYSNYGALRALVNTEKETFTVSTSDKMNLDVNGYPLSSGTYDLDDYKSSGSFLPRKSSGENQTSLGGNEVTLNPTTYQNNLTQNEGYKNNPGRVVAHELLGHGFLWYWKTYKIPSTDYSHENPKIKEAERNVDKK